MVSKMYKGIKTILFKSLNWKNLIINAKSTVSKGKNTALWDAVLNMLMYSLILKKKGLN